MATKNWILSVITFSKPSSITFWLIISSSSSLGGKVPLFSFPSSCMLLIHCMREFLCLLMWSKCLLGLFEGICMVGLLWITFIWFFSNFPHLRVRDLAKFLAFLFADCNLWLWGDYLEVFRLFLTTYWCPCLRGKWVVLCLTACK